MTKKKNGVTKIYYDREKNPLWGEEYFIFNDKIEGECKTYWRDGKIRIICNYKNDKKEGKYKRYHKNGKLYVICNYKNGTLEGEHKSYHTNGQLWEIYNYKNNKIEGNINHAIIIDN